MQFVSNRWYVGYTRALAAVCGGLVIVCGLCLFWSPLKQFGEQWGFSQAILAMSGALIAYCLLVYRYIQIRFSTYTASLVANFWFVTIVLTLVHTTGRLHSWYYVLWLAILAMSGIFGPQNVLALCFLTIIYVAINAIDPSGQLMIDSVAMAGLAGALVAGIVSYLVWRRLYISQENHAIAELSGQLKSTEQQSAILVNSIADGIILIKTDGKISLMNPAAAAMTEWEVDEANGIDANTVINLAREDGQPLTSESNPIAHVLAKQQAMDGVLQLVGRNKKTLIVSVVVSPIILPKNKQFVGAVAVIRDISGQRAEEKRRADFISTASHEMRTPVAAIEGYLALALNDKVSQIDVKARGYLEKAHYSTQHLGQLFQDLLTSAKAEDGRLVSRPVVVEMSAFIEQLVDSLKFAAEKKSLFVEFMLGADTATGGERVVRPLYYAHVDPDRMREVVTNLFDNAVKYTESGKITIGLTGNTQIVQISVRDTGPGIPAEDVPHLFQKFYRVDNSATRSIGGTGLGLFICRKIVELYKGRIWVESEVGKGSAFYINLPRIGSAQAEEMQKQEAAQASVLTDTPMATSSATSSINTP